jgi:sulfur carrier protein ThiS adenylyltransferase/adenylyltransferase/sulfurtransferase
MRNHKEFFLEKYSRQIIMEQVGVEGQKRIYNSSICIIGCGGLGTSAAQYLSMSGIGKLVLIDHDSIVLSNLNRQTLFTEKDIGGYKCKVLSEKIKNINSSIAVNYYKEKISETNIDLYLGNCPIILDCTDNFESRLIINKFCHNKKKILISAALQNFDIQAFIFSSWSSKKNPCYKCIFPSLTSDENLSCDEMGMIASVAGLGGIIQANLALNHILKLNSNFRELILLDSLKLDIKKIKIDKNENCKICCL